MNIQYLTSLRDNPIKFGKTMNFTNRGILETEITQLEQSWNNGNPFPKALKELLFLAGNFCYVLDYGPIDTQQELQEWIRDSMQENNKTISRPFYVVEVWGGDQFYFIYLDEGDNPFIYQASSYDTSSNWNKKTNLTIKSKSEYRISRVKAGKNPF